MIAARSDAPRAGKRTRAFVAPWVIGEDGTLWRDGAIRVDARGRLVALGRARDLRVEAEPLSGVVLPGLVNAHTHLELSHLRVPGGDGLVPWIRRLLATRTPPRADAIDAAVKTLVARGTVAVADVSNTGATVSALERSGLAFRVFLERVAPRPDEPDPPPPVADPRCEPTAHSTYATCERVLRAVGAASIHIEEDPAEAEWLAHGAGPFAQILPSRSPAGRRPVAWLDAMGLLRPGTLLVHMTCADDESLALAARRGAVVVLCPRSNLHIGGRLPRWRAVRQAGCAIALGTDSLASCPSLDVLGEVAVLARDGADPAWLLEAATAGGSRRLGFGPPPGWIVVGDGAAALTDPIAWVAHEGHAAPVRRL